MEDSRSTIYLISFWRYSLSLPVNDSFLEDSMSAMCRGRVKTQIGSGRILLRWQRSLFPSYAARDLSSRLFKLDVSFWVKTAFGNQ